MQAERSAAITDYLDMSSDAKRFWERARDCMNLSKSARSPEDAAMLEEIAAELLEEAKRIEAEEAASPEQFSARR